MLQGFLGGDFACGVLLSTARLETDQTCSAHLLQFDEKVTSVSFIFILLYY
jgi:hypothetical protein